jgi:hypothetical protein
MQLDLTKAIYALKRQITCMLYNIDIWLEIVGTIWIFVESSNFSCAQVKIFI